MTTHPYRLAHMPGHRRMIDPRYLTPRRPVLERASEMPTDNRVQHQGA